MMNNSQPDGNHIEAALLTFLQLEQKARQAETLAELRFIMLNQTKSLIEYEQAILWDAGRNEVVAATNVMTVDHTAPLIQWIQRQSKTLSLSENGVSVHRIDTKQWAEEDQVTAAEYLDDVLIWVPVLDTKQQLLGGIWLSRSKVLTIRDKRLLIFFSDSMGHIWQSLVKRKHSRVAMKWRNKKVACVMAAIIFAAMLLPVRQSVLAPGEVVSSVFHNVRMPIDGIVEHLFVKPNSKVRKGQPLLSLDSSQLVEQLSQARQQLSIAGSELRLAKQQSFYDASRKSSVAILEGKQNLARSQVSYLQEKLSQATVVAKQDGIALFDDQGDWIGRPLRLGEPVMSIADPNHTSIQVYLAVEDRMDFTPGDEVRFFLNSRPTEPVRAIISNVAYRSTLQNDGQYAFVLKASLLEPEKKPVMGLKGIAKVYGQKTSLFYYLFRRPLSHVRLWWGGI